MDLKGRTKSFLELGDRLKNLQQNEAEELFDRAGYSNPWFTKENIQLSIDGLIQYLQEEKLKTWLENYDLSNVRTMNVGVVMAGNIPMVGIHDFLCVLLSGHRIIAKLSSQDEVLVKFIIEELINLNPEFEAQIKIVDKLKEIDAVIATGSDNTARYFHYYFAKIPHIIRKNRTSIAVLNGQESKDDLQALGMDIFAYFGLGCRNVAKLYVPEGYDPTALFSNWEHYSSIADHHKYHNNYHYQRTIMLVNLVPHLDTGYVLLQQNQNLVSPIGMIYYDFYRTEEDVSNEVESLSDKIQCIVSNVDIAGKIKFGKAQMPDIHDFADNIDTMEFLAHL